MFATFAPEKAWYGIDYLDVNSANFEGLLASTADQEDRAAALALVGEPVARQSRPTPSSIARTTNGGCVACHGIEPGIDPLLNQKTWDTPVLNVGTDTREYDILGWTANSGVMNGAYTVADPTPIKPVDAAINILGMSVIGTIEQFCLENPITCALDGSQLGLTQRPRIGELRGAYKIRDAKGAAYESRVLQGVWAAAPYLHNGSVPTLPQLLTPPAQRVQSFAVGPAYDQQNVGLAAKQTQFNYVFQATGCGNLNSGNSNCGHDYGTSLVRCRQDSPAGISEDVVRFGL